MSDVNLNATRETRRYFWDQFIRGRRPSDETRGYRLLEYTARQDPPSPSNTTNAEKYLDADGDHLSIAQVVGSLPVYVRLGQDSNPFIRVREGMVLTRPFRGVTFRIGGKAANEQGHQLAGARVLAYASHGPLIQFPAKEYGFRRVPITRMGLSATTTPQGIESFVFGASAPTFGRMGGTLLLKNTDVAATLLVQGVSGSAAALPAGGALGFPLLPGETLALQLEEPAGPDVMAALDGGGLYLAAAAGTCSFALLASSCEIDDSAGDQLREHVPSMR